MNEECRNQVRQLESCSECFINCDREDFAWFTKVCSKLHRVVWAKVDSHPYWPAKVLRDDSQTPMSIVQFFSKGKEIHWVNSSNIIDYDPNNNPNRNMEGQDDDDFKESLNVSEREAFCFACYYNIILSLIYSWNCRKRISTMKTVN